MSAYTAMLNKFIRLMGLEFINSDYQYRNNPERQRAAKIQLDIDRSRGAKEFKKKKARLKMAKESRRRNRKAA